MTTSLENQIGPEPGAEQPTLPGLPGPIKGNDPERFLSVPGDVGRYLNIIFAGLTEEAIAHYLRSRNAALSLKKRGAAPARASSPPLA